MNYFLIPGNPPAVHFYELWGQEIRTLAPKARIKVSPYLLPSEKTESDEAMRELLRGHRQQLESFYQETGAPSTVMGHSLGGYFALKLLESCPDRIERVVLIHPFLRRPSVEGRSLLRLATLLSSNQKLLKATLRAKGALRRAFPELEFVTNEELLKAARIARHEEATIALDRSPISIPEPLREKIIFLHTKKDWWCQPQVIAELSQQVRVELCEETHNFVTDKGQRLSLLKKILSNS